MNKSIVLSARNIHKSYNHAGQKVLVLKGLDLEIESGKFVAIVGPSGAGKSTLLHILGGLDKPSKGSVLFEGQEIYALDDISLSAARNAKIGFVFQFYHLLAEFDVLENVLMPSRIKEKRLKNEALSQAHSLLEQVGLGARIRHFPPQLSGGEKQRVAIVRALINQPHILLCDEPTGNLDSKTGNEILSLIKQASAKDKMAVIMVTHNAEITRVADAVYNLKDGLLHH